MDSVAAAICGERRKRDRLRYEGATRGLGCGMGERKLLGIIALAPDEPLVIGAVEIPCCVLEEETRVTESRVKVFRIRVKLWHGGLAPDGWWGSINPISCQKLVGGGNCPRHPAPLPCRTFAGRFSSLGKWGVEEITGAFSQVSRGFDAGFCSCCRSRARR
ncbi:MAG: hypothetical protein M2R45_00776 [Verrucomicrobia subdivision 3 bacterium]|nr:hypothetical protein [Limisphaerales bacterium]